MFERNSKISGDLGCVFMVAKNEGNVCLQLACLTSKQQILQAEKQLRNHDGDFRIVIIEDQFEMHSTFETDSVGTVGDSLVRTLKSIRLPFHPKGMPTSRVVFPLASYSGSVA